MMKQFLMSVKVHIMIVESLLILNVCLHNTMWNIVLQQK